MKFRSVRYHRRVVLPTIILLLSPVLFIPFPAHAAFEEKDQKKAIERAIRDARKAVRGGEFQKAIDLYQSILSTDPNHILARLGMSLAAFKVLDYQGCYDQAAEVIKLDPENARARALAGLALLRSGYIENAIAELVESVRLDPKEPLAYGAAAEIDFYEGRTKDARLKALHANALDRTEPDYLITLARASSRIELFNEAADAYEEFLVISPRTDRERRDRIRGLIDFYRRIAGLQVHQVSGPPKHELPFRLGSDRRPYIKVQVNGKPANFVIDTGSGFTVLSKDAAKRFGIDEIARGGTSQAVGGNGKFEIVYGLIRNFQLGELRIRSVPCFIRAFHAVKDRPADEQPDGFIGLSVLSHFLTQLDYHDKVIRFHRDEIVGESLISPNASVVPFRTTQNGLISVETKLDGLHRINAILDSGASSTVVSTRAVDKLQLRDKIIKGQTVRVVGAAGVADNVELLFLRQCQVGNLEQNNLRALILDFDAINETSGFEQGGILGGDFLRHFKVSIHFTKGIIAMEPYSPPPGQ